MPIADDSVQHFKHACPKLFGQLNSLYKSVNDTTQCQQNCFEFESDLKLMMWTPCVDDLLRSLLLPYFAVDYQHGIVYERNLEGKRAADVDDCRTANIDLVSCNSGMNSALQDAGSSCQLGSLDRLHKLSTSMCTSNVPYYMLFDGKTYVHEVFTDECLHYLGYELNTP